jgi:hypothetical protein
MCADQLSRRRFLVESSGAASLGWLSLNLSWISALAGCSREDARRDAAFTHLTPTEARTMRAFAAQILPSDDGAGAVEAGAVHFVDRALGMAFFAEIAPLIHAGLAELDFRAGAFDANGGFASLSGVQQVAILKRIERDRFFTEARTLVLIGTFADPSYGGNIGRAGWAMIGKDDREMYAAPFGWYDAPTGADSAHSAA